MGIGISIAKKWHRFGGREFTRYTNGYKNKWDAKSVATKFRAGKNLARVIREEGLWVVYVYYR